MSSGQEIHKNLEPSADPSLDYDYQYPLTSHLDDSPKTWESTLIVISTLRGGLTSEIKNELREIILFGKNLV